MKMDTAPTDGTRVLLKCKAMLYDGSSYVHDGYEIIEAHYIEGRWRKWCGNERTHSTYMPKPVAWAPIPDGLNDEQVREEKDNG